MKKGKGLAKGKPLQKSSGLTRTSSLKVNPKKVRTKRPTLLAKADQVFSRYVRTKAIQPNGLVPCYTCGKELTIEQMQLGHFMPRAFLQLRFNEDYNKPQCPTCNVTLHGNPKVFREKLEEEFGAEQISKDTTFNPNWKLTKEKLQKIQLKCKNYLNTHTLQGKKTE